MTIMDLETAETIVDQWRTAAGTDNPAGPLYASGAFAESDIIEAESSYTLRPSACTNGGSLCC